MRLLGIGVGVLPGEAEAAGVDFHTRGRRADEAIDVLRLLWAGDDDGVSFDGEFYSFRNLCSFPKPYQARRCPSTSAGRARPPPAGPACAATDTSPAGGNTDERAGPARPDARDRPRGRA